MDIIKLENNEYIFCCPYEDCKGSIVVNKHDLRCKIFRHGIIKSTNKGIPPHSKKSICDSLVSNNLIYGCSRPFKLVFVDKDAVKVIKCDYI